jgi:cellulose synthase/poly-beta-1,6-N-acetylglucosamine synthase-like glycosyltransferase
VTLPGVLLLACGVPVALACGYLLLLTLASGRPRAPAAAARRLRFDLIVPAHDEEAGIAETVRSLLAVDWPEPLRRVLVVADNCQDATAARARAAGAEVLERTDPERRGKGFALEHAFAHSLAGSADALVVVDADTLVSRNLLTAFAARLEAGAPAVQADYGVRNPAASWRTRLIAIALGAFHVLRSRGRERLQLSCGLRGNGMCFSRTLLEQVPHRAFSVVEDLEFGIQLGEAGYRVHYAGEAHVWGEMVSGETASRSQRRRWEGGRRQMALLHGPRLLELALRKRDRVLLDLACDVLVPPLAEVAVATGAGLLLSLLAAQRAHQWIAAASLFSWSAIALIAYVLRGWSLSGTGARGLLDLGMAPLYVIWKSSLALRRKQHAQGVWVRTHREEEQKP